MTAKLLDVAGLAKHYAVRGGALRAVDGVSFALDRGETLAIVGESVAASPLSGAASCGWCGRPEGEVALTAHALTICRSANCGRCGGRCRCVSGPVQQPEPAPARARHRAEPLRNFALASGAALQARVAALLDQVGLRRVRCSACRTSFRRPAAAHRIARALAPGPDLLVCDEAVSALDVSVKAQIVNLLLGLQERLGLGLLFISHDLAIVEHLTHRVAVMYLGRIVELADRRALFATPRHPYTRALLSAVPVPDPAALRNRIGVRGDVPSPLAPPPGCRFHNPLPGGVRALPRRRPGARQIAPGHLVACHLDS